MTTAERVVFEHVTKRYPGTGSGNPGAVEDLSLEVPAGKICVLVGPSGLRQDDQPQDGQPADRADVRPRS